MCNVSTPQTMNKLLEKAGLQYKVNKTWVTTEIGKKFSTVNWENKQYSEGQVQVIKWYESVLDYEPLKELLQ